MGYILLIGCSNLVQMRSNTSLMERQMFYAILVSTREPCAYVVKASTAGCIQSQSAFGRQQKNALVGIIVQTGAKLRPRGGSHSVSTDEAARGLIVAKCNGLFSIEARARQAIHWGINPMATKDDKTAVQGMTPEQQAQWGIDLTAAAAAGDTARVAELMRQNAVVDEQNDKVLDRRETEKRIKKAEQSEAEEQKALTDQAWRNIEEINTAPLFVLRQRALDLQQELRDAKAAKVPSADGSIDLKGYRSERVIRLDEERAWAQVSIEADKLRAPFARVKANPSGAYKRKREDILRGVNLSDTPYALVKGGIKFMTVTGKGEIRFHALQGSHYIGAQGVKDGDFGYAFVPYREEWDRGELPEAVYEMANTYRERLDRLSYSTREVGYICDLRHLNLEGIVERDTYRAKGTTHSGGAKLAAIAHRYDVATMKPTDYSNLVGA